jgi:hypothetical protein
MRNPVHNPAHAGGGPLSTFGWQDLLRQENVPYHLALNTIFLAITPTNIPVRLVEEVGPVSINMIRLTMAMNDISNNHPVTMLAEKVFNVV